MKDNDGGPAFPTDHDESLLGQWRGMTLRDYFAAKAMTAIFTGGVSEGVTDDEIARDAYTIADAMLKARDE